MTEEEGATLLAQGSPKAKNHSPILPAFNAAVKAHNIKSALELLNMKPQDTVELLRKQFPSFDKTVLSKCGNSEKYGCVLHPAGYEILRIIATKADGAATSQDAPPEQDIPKKRYRHKMTRQVSGRLSERKYETLQHYIRLDGYETTQDWVTAQVDTYIGRMIEKYGNPGTPGDS